MVLPKGAGTDASWVFQKASLTIARASRPGSESAFEKLLPNRGCIANVSKKSADTWAARRRCGSSTPVRVAFQPRYADRYSKAPLFSFQSKKLPAASRVRAEATFTSVPQTVITRSRCGKGNG